MKKIKCKRLFINLLCIFLYIVSAFGGFTNVFAADSEIYDFDKVNVMDDLKSSNSFDLADYPYDSAGKTKSPSVMNFVEWCYSPFRPDHFALYIYFYNPQRLDIDAESISNRVQMAVGYKVSNENENKALVIKSDSVPIEYETFQLIFCNKSEGNSDGLFYKFRIIDHKSADGLTIQDRVNSTERRYDVSGITLATSNGSKEITVGGTYRFSGYAKGFGPNENSESTLKNEGFVALETLRLEVYPTTFRTESAALGKNHQNDLNSVYFSIPERYFKNYGNLQRIKAEWWEYKTTPMLIFKSNSDYQEVYSQLGNCIPNYTSAISKEYYNDYKNIGGNYTIYYNVYNVEKKTRREIQNRIETLYYAFYAPDGYVSKERIEDHVFNYDKTYNTGSVKIGGKNISEDLFAADVDEGHTRGYNLKEFDAGESFDLLSYADGNNNKFWDYFLFPPAVLDDTYRNISPIECNISQTTMTLSNAGLAKALYINENDASAFKTFYNAEKLKGNRTVLFRFSQNDYFCEKWYASNPNAFAEISIAGEVVSMAQETVFLDFKIITLTFQQNGNYTVIPVTQDPINIISDVTPTPEGSVFNYLKSLKKVGAWIVLAVAVVIGIIVLFVVLKLYVAASRIGHVILKILAFAIITAAVVIFILLYVPYVQGIIESLGGI